MPKSITSDTASCDATPKLALFTGHSNDVTGLSFSPDGKTLASCAYDSSVVIWDTESWEMKHRLEVDEPGGLHSIAFTSDGAALAADGMEIMIWDASSLELLTKLDSGRLVDAGLSGGILIDGADTMEGQMRSAVIAFDPRQGTCQTLQVYDEYRAPAAVSSDASTIAYMESDRVFCFDRADGKLHVLGWEPRFGKPQEDVTPAISSDGRLIAVASFARCVVWDRAVQQWIGNESDWNMPTNWPFAMTFSPDNTRLAVAYTEGDIQVADPLTGRLVWSARAHRGWVRTAAFSPDGKLLATGGNDHRIRIWRADSGHLIEELVGQEHAANCVKFTPDGTNIVVGCEDGRLREWRSSTGELETHSGRFPSAITDLDISPDGKTAAVFSHGYDDSQESELRLYCRETGRDCQALARCPSHYHPSLSFSPCGTYVAGIGEDGAATIWEASTGDVVRRLCGRYLVLYSPRANILVTGGCEGHPTIWSAETLRVWSTGSWDLVAELKSDGRNGEIYSATFSPDGKTLVASHYIDFSTWNTETWQYTRMRTHSHTSDELRAIDVSPDGKTVALGGSYEENVYLRATRTGRLRRALAGHTGPIEGVAFSPDGRKLTTVAEDGIVRVWNPRTGRLLVTLLVLPHKDNDDAFNHWLAYTPEGYYDGSSAVEELIRWQMGGEFLPGQSFAEQFRQPDRIRQILR